jgi:hypothetical protein
MTPLTTIVIGLLAIAVVLLILEVCSLAATVAKQNQTHIENLAEIRTTYNYQDMLKDELATLKRKHDRLFISKLKIMAENNPDFFKEQIGQELKTFLAENSMSDMFDIAIMLTSDVNKQFLAIANSLEQKMGFVKTD